MHGSRSSARRRGGLPGCAQRSLNATRHSNTNSETLKVSVCLTKRESMNEQDGQSPIAPFSPRIVAAAGLLTVSLYAIAAYSPLRSAWGINQLIFLDRLWITVPALSFLAIIAVATLPGSFDRTGSWLEKLATMIWERGPLPRIALAALMLLFYFFRQSIFFIGDGYHLLNSFGGLSSYQAGFTKFGAVLAVRGVQHLLGEHTYESAQVAFQLLSIVCGGLTVVFIAGIVGEMTTDRIKRVMALIVLLLSGTMLIFFGHVEFYPLVWAAASLWFYLSLRELNGRGSITATIIVFGVMVLFHIMAISFFPALLFLIWHRVKPQSTAKLKTGAIVTIVLALPLLAVASAALLRPISPQVATYFLPLTARGSSFAHYPIISLQNLHELSNLVMALFPCAMVMATQFGFWKHISGSRTKLHYAMLAASGGLCFALVIQPALGMARDIDLMSLMLFPLALLCLSAIGASQRKLPVRSVLIVLLVCFTGAVSFLAVNISRAAAERRVLCLLQHYGEKDRGGWISYAAYLNTQNDLIRYRRTVAEMNRIFPAESVARRVDSLVVAGKLDQARKLATELVQSYPDDGVYLRNLADIMVRQGDNPGALDCYQRAMEIRPDHVTMRGLAALYQKQGRHKEALALLERAHDLAPKSIAIIEAMASSCLHAGDLLRADLLADSLFTIEGDAPGGHIIKMLVAVANGRIEPAREHYRRFKQIGQRRADYDQIVLMYDSMLN